MNQEKFKLTDEDFSLLLPGKVITIGKSQVPIKPLGIADLKFIFQRLASIWAVLSDKGITTANYNQEDNLFTLVEVIMDKAPDVLADASGIEVGDLQRLPLVVNVKILTEVLKINIESQEGLEKNLNELAGMIQELRVGAVGETPSTDQGSELSSRGSSKVVTRGPKSRSTRRAK